jgi:hypothetical protein
MAGYGSDRTSGKPVVEDAIRLDAGRCLSLGYLRPGLATSGIMPLIRSPTGQVTASITYEADLRDVEYAWLRLHCRTKRFAGAAHESVDWIDLTTTRPYLGGIRWWFECPVSGRRVRCLYLIGNGDTFASREVHGLGYRSQRETHSDRLIRTARALDAKLGGDGNLLGNSPAKPKWMRWPTYWRLRNQLEHASLQAVAGKSGARGSF